MILTVRGVCGETLYFDPEEMEFAYEIIMLNHKVMYMSMKSGKKFFLDMDESEFRKLCRQFMPNYVEREEV